jgi:solute carrier family 35 protein E1
MYNNAKRDVEKGEKRMRQVEAVREGLLPSNKIEARMFEGKIHSSRKPVYTDHVHASKSSALHNMSYPATVPVNDIPYPSPPPSTASSPPSEPVFMHGPPRHRRMSDVKEGHGFRLPPSAALKQPHAIRESPIELTA